jgi:hypothetical protein
LILVCGLWAFLGNVEAHAAARDIPYAAHLEYYQNKAANGKHAMTNECRPEWNALQSSKIFETFKRDEVPRRLAGHPPASFNQDKFTPSWSASGEQDSIDLKSILKGKFHTFSLAGSRQTYGDAHFMIDLHERGREHLADAAWHAQLLPLGHVIHDTLSGEYLMLFEAPIYLVFYITLTVAMCWGLGRSRAVVRALFTKSSHVMQDRSI